MTKIPYQEVMSPMMHVVLVSLMLMSSPNEALPAKHLPAAAQPPYKALPAKHLPAAAQPQTKALAALPGKTLPAAAAAPPQTKALAALPGKTLPGNTMPAEPDPPMSKALPSNAEPPIDPPRAIPRPKAPPRPPAAKTEAELRLCDRLGVPAFSEMEIFYYEEWLAEYRRYNEEVGPPIPNSEKRRYSETKNSSWQ